MKRILIADPSKASMVMTSEVFKDNFPGVQVLVARSAEEALELAKTNGEVDAFIVDFDLPDRNGAETAADLKKFSTLPILITGYDRPEVHMAIEKELAGYDDCMSWIKKPVRAETIVEIARRYIDGKYRCQRRLGCTIPALLELKISERKLVKVAAPKKAAAKKTKAKVKAKGKKGKAVKAAPKATKSTYVTTTKKVWANAKIEDASLGGIRIRLSKKSMDGVGFKKTDLTQVKVGTVLTLQVPPTTTVAKTQFKPTSTLSVLASGTKKAAPKATKKPELQTVKGKVMWTRLEGGDIVCGMMVENSGHNKKFFDAVLVNVKAAPPVEAPPLPPLAPFVIKGIAKPVKLAMN